MIEKFGIQSSIVIPSLVTVKHLYNNLINKPIIGSIIRDEPIRLSELLSKNIPLYPTLYDIDKYVPHFNADIGTLSPPLISRLVDISAVDILDRPSSVVKRYSAIKDN